MDRIFKTFFLLGAFFLFFVFGAASLHYGWSVGAPIVHAFEAAKTWKETYSAVSQQEQTVAGAGGSEIDYANLTKKISWSGDNPPEGEILLTLRGASKAWLIDMQGNELHRWVMPFKKAFPNPTHVNKLAKAKVYFEKAEMFENGDLLAIYSGLGDTPHGYGLVKMDVNSNVIWTFADNVHHDFYIDKHTGEIYTLVHKFMDRAPTGLEGLPFPMLVDYVVKLSPEGKELDRVSLLDAFRGSPFELMLYYKNNKEVWDHFHTNSIAKLEPEMAAAFPLFQEGDVLLSMRNMSTIAVLNMNSKKIKWATQGVWRQQHAAHLKANGNIMMFDNQGHFLDNKPYSRILEYNPISQEVEWSFAGNRDKPFYSETQGRVQAINQDSYFVTESNAMRIFEIDGSGDTIFSLSLIQGRGAKENASSIASAVKK